MTTRVGAERDSNQSVRGYRWEARRGEAADFALLKSAGVVIAALVVCIVAALVLGRGMLLVSVWAGAVAALAYVTFGKAGLAARVRRSWVVGHLWAWPSAIHHRVTSHPDLKGDLADGFWLPLQLRLLCWAALPLGVAAGLLTALLLAPPSNLERRITDLRSVAAAADYRAREMRPSKGNAPDRGQKILDGALAGKEADLLDGKPPSGSTPIVPNPKPGNPPPKPTKDSGSPGKGKNGSRPTPQGKPPIYVDPPVTQPGQTTTTTTKTTSTETRERKVWFSGLPLPFMVIASLVGWGSSTEYRDNVLTAVQKVVDSQPLTEDELLRVLKDVPAEGVDEVAQQLRQLISEKTLDPAAKANSLAALDAAVAKRKASQPMSRETQLVDKIVAMLAGNPAIDPAEVASSLKAELPNGKFPSPNAKDAFRDLLKSNLADKFDRYWPAIDKDL